MNPKKKEKTKLLRLLLTATVQARYCASPLLCKQERVKTIVRWLVGFTVFIGFSWFIYRYLLPLLLHSQKQGAIVYNVISNKVLYQIIIGVVICVLTFVIETYIFTKIDNDNLFIQ